MEEEKCRMIAIKDAVIVMLMVMVILTVVGAGWSKAKQVSKCSLL
jgi:hypothetical protein